MKKIALLAPLALSLLFVPVGAQDAPPDMPDFPDWEASATAASDIVATRAADAQATMDYWATEEANDVAEIDGDEAAIETELARPPVDPNATVEAAGQESANPTPIARVLPSAGTGPTSGAGITLFIVALLSGLAWLAVRPKRINP